jgi:ribosomal protein L30E
MKKAIFMMTLLLILTPSLSYGFRCGTRVVAVGDTKVEVLAKCGQPDLIETEQIREVFTSADKGVSQKITMIVETWTYNLGPRRLVKILKFAGSKLISIEDGGYGTVPERSLETISTADKIRLVQALQKMAEKGELVIWNPNTNQSFSGRDIEQIVLNGNAIQISLSKSNK